jgi:hypothetical protein
MDFLGDPRDVALRRALAATPVGAC